MQPKVVQLEEGVWEIVDQQGYSVFSTHCEDCGSQFFFGDLRLLKCKRVCQSCKAVRNAPAMAIREELIIPSGVPSRTLVKCKNFLSCGETMLRSQQYRRSPTCYPCKRMEQRIRERTYA